MPPDPVDPAVKPADSGAERAGNAAVALRRRPGAEHRQPLRRTKSPRAPTTSTSTTGTATATPPLGSSGHDPVVCPICRHGRFDRSHDVGVVSSNAKSFREERFTVWRCPDCDSLHALEPIDYARYYDGYFMQRQPLDFFSRRLFAQRLRDLEPLHPAATATILDHGCGNGNFVRFLRERGFSQADGYDPYSPGFADRAVLDTRYDVVTSQDVIEHAPDPGAYLDEVAARVRPGGVMAIGTPNAEHIDLADPIDEVGPLHQPFHRHILTGKRLVAMIEARGFKVVRVIPRSYVDTWLPFVNSAFLFNYMAAVDGTVESGFEPIRTGLILTSPKLLFHGFFGRLEKRRKDILVLATAP